MRPLVILGAGGYIGMYLTEALSKEHAVKAFMHKKSDVFKDNPRIKVFSGDILDESALEKVISDGDIVINLAGTTTAEKEEKNHYDANVYGQDVVAMLCAKTRAKVIYFSTINIYNNVGDFSKETDDVDPKDIYPLTKRLGEKVYESYSGSKDLDAIVFRLGSVYGPGQMKGVIFSMADSLKKTGVIEVPKAEVARDLVHIDDVIDAVKRAILFSKKGFHLFNISGGKGHRLTDLAESILLVSGRNGLIKKVERDVRPLIVRASIELANKELGFYPKVSIEKGLKKTLASYGI